MDSPLQGPSIPELCKIVTNDVHAQQVGHISGLDIAPPGDRTQRGENPGGRSLPEIQLDCVSVLQNT